MTSREKFEAWYLENWGHTEDDHETLFERDPDSNEEYYRLGVRMAHVAWQASELASQQKLTDIAVQLANAESKCRELAAELSAVDKIHNEAVFITDDHYEQCPPEVQKMIRSLAVLQIPAYDAFLAEARASARNDFIGRIEWIIRNECNPEKTEEIINELQNFSDELKLEAAQ